MNQTLEVERTEENETLKTETSLFDVFDMHRLTTHPAEVWDCKWRCDNTDRCARYEWDAKELVCKMFEKAY